MNFYWNLSRNFYDNDECTECKDNVDLDYLHWACSLDK